MIFDICWCVQDLFGWGEYMLSAQYTRSAMRAIPYVMLTQDDKGKSCLTHYAKATGITQEVVDALGQCEDSMQRAKQVFLEEIVPLQAKVSELIKKIHSTYVSNRQKKRWGEEVEQCKEKIHALYQKRRELESPLTPIALNMLSAHPVDSQQVLNMVHVLTVPLLAVVQLGCITDPCAYVRGAWMNIKKVYKKKRLTCAPKWALRHLEPMIANMHLGLSLIQDEKIRQNLMEKELASSHKEDNHDEIFILKKKALGDFICLE